MSGVKFYSPTIDDIFIEIRFAKVSKSSRFGGYREFSDSMPRKLKFHDRVKGKRLDIRNLMGAVVEVILRLGPDEFRIRWDNGVIGNYLSRHVEILDEAPPAAADNIPPPAPLAQLDGARQRQGPGRRNFIAYNHEYDDSDVESNYGSR